MSKVALLPEGEVPAIITVTDKESITENREFFASAQNGDKVLVYQQAQKAFLYRPETNQLINLAPLNPTDDIQGQQFPQPTVAGDIDEAEDIDEPITVELRNGADIEGITFDFESTHEASLSNVKVTSRSLAADTYEESILAVTGDVSSARAQTLADVLGLELKALPDKETSSSADVVIIVGSDFSQ